MKKCAFKRKIILFLSLLILGSFNAESQNKIKGFSIGTKLYPDFFDTYVGLEIDILSNNYVFSLDDVYYEEFAIFITPYERCNYLSLLVGKYIGHKYFRFQYQTGISVVWGIERTNLDYTDCAGWFCIYHYNSKNIFTLGLPLELGFKFIPWRYIAIGVDIESNLNFDKSFILPMLSLEGGILRDKIKKRSN